MARIFPSLRLRDLNSTHTLHRVRWIHVARRWRFIVAIGGRTARRPTISVRCLRATGLRPLLHSHPTLKLTSGVRVQLQCTEIQMLENAAVTPPEVMTDAEPAATRSSRQKSPKRAGRGHASDKRGQLEDAARHSFIGAFTRLHLRLTGRACLSMRATIHLATDALQVHPRYTAAKASKIHASLHSRRQS